MNRDLRPNSRSLPMALLRARETVMNRFRPMLAKNDITEQQWRVLRVLAESGPLDTTGLAARSCILRPSLTLILRTLHARKLISLARNRRDTRRLVIQITPEALRFLNRLAPRSNAIHKSLEEDFGTDRMENLLDVLEELANLKRRASREPGGLTRRRRDPQRR